MPVFCGKQTHYSIPICQAHEHEHGSISVPFLRHFNSFCYPNALNRNCIKLQTIVCIFPTLSIISHGYVERHNHILLRPVTFDRGRYSCQFQGGVWVMLGICDSYVNEQQNYKEYCWPL